jgi:ubiquitin C-terminal hydrolase
MVFQLNKNITKKMQQLQQQQETSSCLDNEQEYQQFSFDQRHVCGIINVGNTCYLNSALQALCATQSLFESLQYDKQLIETFNNHMTTYKNEGKHKQMRSLKLCYLMRAINSHLVTKQSQVNVRDFVHLLWNVHPHFRPYYQEDSQEAIQFLLDILHEESKQLVNDDNVSDQTVQYIIRFIRQQHEQDFKKEQEQKQQKQSEQQQQQQQQQQYTPIKLYTSPIYDIFGGYLLNEVTCLNCNHVSSTVNAFLDLQLPIPNYKTISQQQQQQSSTTTTTNEEEQDVDMKRTKLPTSDTTLMEQQVSLFQSLLRISDVCGCFDTLNIFNYDSNSASSVDLFDCLDVYFEEDRLDEENSYKCSVCKSSQESIKKFSLIKLPRVFCFHLKRFHATTQTGFFSGVFSSSITKTSQHVDFPDEFTIGEMKSRYMKDFVPTNNNNDDDNDDNIVYRLCAVVNHHGYGMSSGHYTSYIRANDRWFHCDDSRITKVDSETVHSSQAYILLYERILQS